MTAGVRTQRYGMQRTSHRPPVNPSVTGQSDAASCRVGKRLELASTLAILLLVPCAAAAQPPQTPESGLLDRIQSGLDGVARGFDYMGQLAEDVIGPGLGLGAERPAAHTETRAFNERYPTGPAPIVSVANEFGEIRVDTWEDRVVAVTAAITVGAEAADIAAEVAR